MFSGGVNTVLNSSGSLSSSHQDNKVSVGGTQTPSVTVHAAYEHTKCVQRHIVILLTDGIHPQTPASWTASQSDPSAGLRAIYIHTHQLSIFLLRHLFHTGFSITLYSLFVPLITVDGATWTELSYSSFKNVS